MSRKLTPQSSLENLKREAKRWLAAIRDHDPEALSRFARALAGSSMLPSPTLRDVQLALAREHGFSGWGALRTELARQRDGVPGSRGEAIPELFRAAGRGDVARVETLLAAYPDIVNAFDHLEGNTGRRTALHHGSGHATVVRALLAHGANPNIRDEGDDAMPLHFAAERGDLEVVRLLVEHGADPVGAGTGHELNVLGWATCFEYAYHEPVARYLLAHGARHTIHTAVAMGDTAAIQTIAGHSPAELERPMDRTNRRRRPLHLAVVKNRPDSLATLLALGADAESEDAAGLTPLDQAALRGDEAMARLLLERGARARLPAAVALDRRADLERLLREEPDSLRPGGRWGRLIIRASERGSARMVEALIRAGASVHVRDRSETAIDQTHGFTALHAAAASNNIETARVLLAHGANPADREDKYWATPAGWADYLGHPDLRDVILEGPIDIFDAIRFRPERIAEVLARDPEALERPLGQHVNGDPETKPWLDVKWTPVAYAIAHGKPLAARHLADRGADVAVRDSKGRTPVDMAREAGDDDLVAFLEPLESSDPARRGRRGDPTDRPTSATADLAFQERVADLLRWACPDWRVSGSQREYRRRDALRLLERDPDIAHANLYTSVVCGGLDDVRRRVEARPAVASEIGGPRSWPPLLYLCACRLPLAGSADHAVEIARILLDNGADPNVFYLGGNADIHYTALTVVLGRGEDRAPMHPKARELAKLLLERGADPHDNQVLYNVFADNTSRGLLDDDIIWLLELMHEHSVRRGHRGDWENPEWPMFDMGGAPSLGDEARRHPGAHFMLSGAVDRNLLRLAEWMLQHGAGPNTPPGQLWRVPQRSLYEDARLNGYHDMAELLARHGAERISPKLDSQQRFVDACLTLDRKHVHAYLKTHPEALRDHRAIFEAVRRDRADVVEMLLDLGVSPDVADQGGVRPLHIASWGSEQSAAVLIARGADVDARDKNYDSPPLGWAAWAVNQRMMEVLGRHSRDVWYLTYTGRVDRLREVLGEQPELARLVNDEGETPLLWLPGDEDAAVAIVQLLLTAGADASRQNAQGLTARDIARRRGMDRVIRALDAVGDTGA